MIAKRNQADKLIRSNIRAMGKEVVSQIECVRIHSYTAAGSHWIAIGTNVPPTCRVGGACGVAISNRHLEETTLQIRRKRVKTKRKGCMDETVETKGTLERKTENLLSEDPRGYFKKEEYGG